MAGALIVASHAEADELGVPPDHRVYLHGWCYATDPVYVAEHPDLAPSPAMAAASTEALRVAGLDDRRRRPPRSLQVLRQLGGLRMRRARHRSDDPRGSDRHGWPPVPRWAGPATTCCTASRPWSTCCAPTPGRTGLVSGVGMHMTKHVFAVYGSEPPMNGRIVPPAQADVQARLDFDPPVAIVPAHDGVATVALLHRGPRPQRRGRMGPRVGRRAWWSHLRPGRTPRSARRPRDRRMGRPLSRAHAGRRRREPRPRRLNWPNGRPAGLAVG